MKQLETRLKTNKKLFDAKSHAEQELEARFQALRNRAQLDLDQKKYHESDQKEYIEQLKQWRDETLARIAAIDHSDTATHQKYGSDDSSRYTAIVEEIRTSADVKEASELQTREARGKRLKLAHDGLDDAKRANNESNQQNINQ